MSRSSTSGKLPARPDLNYLKKLAKERLTALRADRPAAKLADAQLVIAREHGFDSWRKMKSHIEASVTAEQIAACVKAIRRGDAQAVLEMIEQHPSLRSVDTGNGATALHRAAEYDQPAIIKLLISGGADISAKFGRYAHTPLSWALMCRSLDAAKSLIEVGAKADLFCAAGMGDLQAVQTFFTADGGLCAGASQTGSSRYKKNGELLRCPPIDDREVIADALYSAARNGHPVVVEELLRHEPLLDFRAYMGGTPLHWAYFGASQKAIDLLLSAGADPNNIDDLFKCTPRAFGICVASKWGMLKLVQLQLANDSTLANVVGGRGTPLHEAARGGHLAIIRLLLNGGADAKILDSAGATVSDVALQKDRKEILQLLNEPVPARKLIASENEFLDAAVPKPDSDHKSGPLEPARKMLLEHPELADSSIFTACAIGNIEAVRRFLKSNPTLARTTGGIRDWPPLCYLCFSRFLRDEPKPATHFVETARLLLTAGADPNSSWPSASDPNFREAALYGAAGIANCAPLTQLLITAGADVNDHESLYHASEFADNAALRVLLVARPAPKSVSYNLCHKMDMEDPGGVELFIEHGADVNVLLKRGLFNGSRPLHFAIYRRRSLKVFNILLAAGANPNLPDGKGVTPYQLACKFGLRDVAGLLKLKGADTHLDPHTRLLAALAGGNRKTVEAMLKNDPSLKAQITTDNHKLLVDAGESGNAKAVGLMLDFGFPIATRGTSYGGWDSTALDQSAWNGHARVVRLLLKRGADPSIKHGFGGDALGAAIHGASHAEHSRGVAAAKALAEVASDQRLEKAIQYAATEPNQNVTAMLSTVLKKRISARKKFL